MTQHTGRPLTHQDVIDAVNFHLADLLDYPPADAIYTYHPGMRCYEVSRAANGPGLAVWTVFIEKALPEDDALRLNVAAHLENKFAIAANVVLEW